MTRFFDGAMRFAAMLLFVLAIILLITGVAAALQTWSVMGRMGPIGPDASTTRGGILVNALALSISLSAIPYFGAALLWRLDRLGDGSGQAREI